MGEAGEYGGNVERFSGFADDYDRYRFRPPPDLLDLLCRFAGVERPALVVDLGCGTGISSRFWAARAERVIGIEPTADMRNRARAATPQPNVEYREGLGHETGLPDGVADVVTCAQSFHWMEPAATLAEVGRVLRPGGVFAAYDYHVLPAVTGIVDLDEAVDRAHDRIVELEVEHGLKRDTRFWPKDGHTRSLQESGVFRAIREVHLHHVQTTSVRNIVGGVESFGAVRSLRKRGVTDEAMGIVELATTARRCLGDGEAPIFVGYVVHVGVTRCDTP